MNRNNNVRVPVGCLTYLIIGVVMWVVFTVRGCIHQVYLDPFKAHFSEYTTVSSLKPNRAQAYLKGKIIAVNKKEKKIDDIYFKLPEELRATKPENVGTIVWLDWGEDEVGTYTDAETATVITCHMTVIDKSIPAIVGEINFRGDDPPELKKRLDSSSGTTPDEDIVFFLQNVPKK
jgi:hypothetical protein